MNYDLAKKLKDAGFPQPECDIDFAAYPQGIVWCGKHLKGHEFVSTGKAIAETNYAYVPTLSELIEACMPLSFYYLRWTTSYDNSPEDHWTACTHGNDKGFGSTPEEAVANLWLALQKD